MITMVSQPDCPYCDKAKTLLSILGIEYRETVLDTVQKKAAFKASGFETVPQIYHKGHLIGGYDDLVYVVNQRFNEGTPNDRLQATPANLPSNKNIDVA